MENIFNYLKTHSETRTPCYVYSREILQNQIQVLKSSLPSNVQVIYSVKANPFKPLIEELAKKVDGFDISSKKELDLVQSMSLKPSLLSIVGPAKKPEDMLEGSFEKQEIHYVVESQEEWQEFKELKINKKENIKALFRVHFADQYNYSGRKVSNKFSQFGVESKYLIMNFKKIFNKANDLQGFHFHLGSQFLDFKITLENIRLFLNFVSEIKNKFSFIPRILNLGGGWGIPYFEEQKAFDLQSFSEGLKKLLELPEYQFLNDTKFIFELGRFIVGPTGFFVMRVVRKKEENNKITLIVDGGLGQNLSLIGFGQALKRPYIIKTLLDEKNDSKETVTVAGPSCYSMDIIAENIELPKLNVGDFLIAYNCGAYAKSFSPTNFLSFAEPGETLI